VSSGGSILVTALRVVAVAGLLVGAITLRVMYSGEREIALSTEELRRGRPYEATQHARRAAGWYAPGAPHVRVAYARLVALATTAEKLGDRDAALFAWRAVRTAALETRWIFTPHVEDLGRANEAIARLSAAAPRPPGTRAVPPSEVLRQQLAALARDEGPDTFWVIAMILAAVAWSGGAAWVVRRATRPSGQVLWPRAAPALVVAGVGIAIWLAAIWRA
jgi:hypothetical protein